MPYRYGHYFVGLVLLVILGGFWASYFAPIGNVPLAFHVHAVTSMTWLSLLIVQHMSIHRRANALHRQMGKASFVLFPLLIIGFAMILNVSAERYAARADPFIMHFGPSAGIGMLIAICAYITLFYQALRNRRNTRLHAGYMLATPLILFESPFSRVMDQFAPWMNFIASQGPQQVNDMIAISNGMAIILALTLYFMDRRHGAPWLVASAFMALQSVAMWNAPYIPSIHAAFTAFTAVPLEVTLFLAIAAGGLTGWLGWRAGSPAAKTAVVTA